MPPETQQPQPNNSDVLHEHALELHDNANQLLEHHTEQHQDQTQLLEHNLELQDEGNQKLDKIVENTTPKEVQKIEIVAPTDDEGALQRTFFEMLRGRKGEKGDSIKGDKGDTGEALTWEMLTDEQKAQLKGEKGNDGIDADEQAIIHSVLAKIPMPKDGKDGRAGKDGIGLDGKDGKDGRDGKDGKDAKAFTADQILTKIKGKISYKDLADVPDIFSTQRQNANHGPINGMTGPGFLQDIADVYIATVPTNGQVLTWDNTNKRWSPTTISGALPSQTGNNGKFLTTDGTNPSWATVSGTGTVTSVSVVTANGVSGSVATATTTPAITITLGAITPTSVNSVVISGASTPTLSVTGTSSISGSHSGTASGTNTGDQTTAGTANRITVTNGSTSPVIDIAATYVGQASITTLGTIATGTWNATTIGLAKGGTNADLSATGGANQFLKQTSSGGAITVAAITTADLGTALNPQFATIELGAATDTTLSRSAAGVLAVEGVVIPSISSTNTLTNKRITLRIGTEASSATSTPTADTVDQWNVTALAAADAFAAPTGTPTDGQKLMIRIKDNGTARALTWNAIYRASSDLALPTTTIISKTLYLGFVYNAADSKWDLIALLNNF